MGEVSRILRGRPMTFEGANDLFQVLFTRPACFRRGCQWLAVDDSAGEPSGENNDML